MPVLDWEQDVDRIVEHISHNSTLKICAKVLDEPLLLETWISHHAQIVGPENLIIADNGSTDARILSIYERLPRNILVFRFSGPHNQIHWHPRFSKMFSALRESCKYFSFIDVDERLVWYEDGELRSDGSIVALFERHRPSGITPATWIVNRLNSFDTFSLRDRNGHPELVRNLRWGKPIFPARLIADQAGIHSAQYDNYDFTTAFGTRLFLLHLTQFPERRISTNRNKLESRGVIGPGVTSNQVLSMNFEEIADKSFMPLVDEMRRMREIQLGGTPEEAGVVGLRIDGSGAVSFFDVETESLFSEFIQNGCYHVCSNLGVFDDDNLIPKDPESLLRKAVRLRSESQHWRAERLFRIGAARYPDFSGEYGGPAFRKELLRMFLGNADWDRAKDLVPSIDDQFGVKWHLVLFARAYLRHGIPDEADIWWGRVLAADPENGEAQDYFRKRMSGALDAHESAAKRAILNYFVEDLSKVQISLQASRINVHHFIAQFLKHTKRSADEAYYSIAEMISSAKRVVEDVAAKPCGKTSDNPIPRIIHRIWLTDAAAPAEPPSDYVDRLISESEKYTTRGWELFLWVRDLADIPLTIRRLDLEGGRIRVMRIEEGDATKGWANLYRAFLRDRKFPFAADVLRVKLLHEYGGFYADLGVNLVHPLVAEFISDHFDYAFIFWETMFFQNSFMAMRSATTLSERFLAVCDDPYVIPKEIIYPVTGISEGMAFSGLMITALLLGMDRSGLRVLPLAPNARLVSWSSQKSWYTKTGATGKLGNTYVPDSRPSFFSEEWPSEGGNSLLAQDAFGRR